MTHFLGGEFNRELCKASSFSENARVLTFPSRRTSYIALTQDLGHEVDFTVPV
jgi:hypothetical protein